MPDPTYNVPTSIRAGDTLKFYVAAPDTPADQSWVGTAFAYGPTTKAGTVTAYGADFLVTFSATDTAAMGKGDFRLAVFATKSGERFTILERTIRLEVNAATVATSAGQEHPETMLIAIRAELVARIAGTGSGNEGYSIGGRSISKIPIRELQRLEHLYVARVRRLQNRGRPMDSVTVQFVPPGAGK